MFVKLHVKTCLRFVPQDENKSDKRGCEFQECVASAKALLLAAFKASALRKTSVFN